MRAKDMRYCSTCGNERDALSGPCPFCEEEQERARHPFDERPPWPDRGDGADTADRILRDPILRIMFRVESGE